MICREKEAHNKTISTVFVEDSQRYLGDGLLQPVEGVDYSHVPPLTLGQWTDDLTGITLSAQLQTERLEPPEPSDAMLNKNICHATNQLFRLDAKELDGLGGVLCHSQRQARIKRGDIQLAATTANAFK